MRNALGLMVAIVVSAAVIATVWFWTSSPRAQLAASAPATVAAAELASIPVLDLMDADLQTALSDPSSNVWAELNVLSRAEVSQATGMLMAQLGIDAAEALVRLRAYAYAADRSAVDVARDILDRRLRLEDD